jgi:hypothetical protein
MNKMTFTNFLLFEFILINFTLRSLISKKPPFTLSVIKNSYVTQIK